LRFGGDVDEGTQVIRLTDEQRIEWLRLIRSPNVGPRGIMAQTPQAWRRRARHLRPEVTGHEGLFGDSGASSDRWANLPDDATASVGPPIEWDRSPFE
jgi:hypothetical protein